MINDHCNVIVELFSAKVCIVHSRVIQSIVEERIKIGPETRGHQLDVPTLYCHHERCDASMGENVVLEFINGHELVKSLNIARTASKVKRRSPIIVCQVDVRAQGDNLLYI